MTQKTLPLIEDRSPPAAGTSLRWLLAQDGVIAIPKAGSVERVEENAAALAQPLGPEQLAELDRLFPPPAGPAPLAML